MPIRQITIIGTGLIGGSFGLALKKSGFSGRIVGCDRAPVLEQALKIGTIDSAQTDPIEAVRGSQLILLAAPVGAIIELIGRLGPALPPDALLTDTGGTKREIMAQAAKVSDGVARALMAVQTELEKQAAPDGVRAHITSATFPG